MPIIQLCFKSFILQSAKAIQWRKDSLLTMAFKQLDIHMQIGELKHKTHFLYKYEPQSYINTYMWNLEK